MLAAWILLLTPAEMQNSSPAQYSVSILAVVLLILFAVDYVIRRPDMGFIANMQMMEQRIVKISFSSHIYVKSNLCILKLPLYFYEDAINTGCVGYQWIEHYPKFCRSPISPILF